MGRVARHRRWVLAVVALAGACASRPSAPPPPSVVLVVIDTLRADRLGSYGHPTGLTPTLDRLAEDATVFHHASAQSSWTLPAVASLLTSRYPSQHRVDYFWSKLHRAETTLAEVLHDAGWTTAAFVANGLLGARSGFAQGFDAYRRFGGGAFRSTPSASTLNDAALGWLADRDPAAPVFLYLHYMEPHAPYAPSREALARVAGAGRPVDVERANREVAHAITLGAESPMADDVQHLIARAYDASVATADAELAHLLDGLEAAGVLDRAIVVVTADHGEELRDHGHLGHGHTLYEELTHVPLLIALPGQRRRRDVSMVVRQVDVAPTILAAAGVAAPPQWEGRDLGPLLRGEGAPEPLLSLSELRLPGFGLGVRRSVHWVAITSDAGKLLLSRDGTQEIYDLQADPGETNPEGLTPFGRTQLRTGLATLRSLYRRNPSPKSKRKRIDATTSEQLRALGYVP